MKKNPVKIKYNGKEFYVMANVEYKGIKYYYIMENVYSEENSDLDNLKEDLHVEVNFIYKLPNGLYQNVVDDELYAELNKLINIDYIAGNNQFCNLDDDE